MSIDRRQKNKEFPVVTEDNRWADIPEGMTHAVLMDIRDELRAIRENTQALGVLRCGNFIRIPHTLREIRKNTQKKPTKKKPLK